MIPLIFLNNPQTGVRLKEEHTLAYINNVCKGSGTLYITENDIVWINSCSEGFTLKYPDISVFAVCTDQEKYPESCVFMLVQDENSTEEDECNSDSDEDFGKEAEIRFAPSEGTSVSDLFNCIQECNRLYSLENEGSSGDSEAEEESDNDYGSPDTTDSFFNGNGNENKLLCRLDELRNDDSDFERDVR